jgi:hypothetical protein
VNTVMNGVRSQVLTAASIEDGGLLGYSSV